MFVINCKDISPYRFPLPTLVLFMTFVLSLGHVDRKSRHVTQFLTVYSMSVSTLPSRWTHMPVALFSVCPCDSGTTVSVLCLVIMQILLFSFLSWQFYLWLQLHLWMTSLAVVPSVPQLLLSASCGVHILTECLDVYHLRFPFLSLLMSCYVCAWLYCIWLCTFLVFLHLCLSHGCVWTANQASTVFLCCSDGFVSAFFAACVIGLQHLKNFYQWLVICYHTGLKGKAVVVELF